MLQVEQSRVTNIPMLTGEECLAVRKTVEDLKEFWVHRHPIAPFYTLGASNYFDLAYHPTPPYYSVAQQYNQILRERFAWLYERLATTLSIHLQAPIDYRESLALPGFHIFLSHSAFVHPRDLTHGEWFRARYDPETVSNPIHCDTPHLLFNWGSSYAGVDFEHPISFTLAIELPQSGAGMYVWDLHRDETLGLSQANLLQLFQTRRKSLHPYTVGSLAFHSGLHYHQIAPFWNIQPNDARITLQGHGICCQGRWQLYW